VFEMSLIKRALLTTAVAVGLSMAVAAPASAYIACNRDGDCWHTENRIDRPEARFDYHPDDWYFHRHWDSDREHHYRDYHEGRGYYRGGVWISP
jgi:hypothetical protein